MTRTDAQTAPARRVAISGSWRHTPRTLIDDVERDVAEIVRGGGVIVTGGALGVDHIASATALSIDRTGAHLHVIIPTPLTLYARHYRRRAAEGVITSDAAETLIALLALLRQLGSLTEMDGAVVDESTYYARNTAVLDDATELYAYQVNSSAGTQDTIDKARAREMAVIHRTYGA